jgi:uncharacterized protein (TIGR03067 family)
VAVWAIRVMRRCEMTARVVVLFVLLSLGGYCAGGDKKNDTKSDQDLLQGEWTVVSIEMSGKNRANVTNMKLVIKGDDWTPPQGMLRFTFKLDTTKSPKWLTLATEKGKEWQGIYKIEADTFTFCRSAGSGGERPTEFKGGPGVFLMVCKRAGK